MIWRCQSWCGLRFCLIPPRVGDVGSFKLVTIPLGKGTKAEGHGVREDLVCILQRLPFVVLLFQERLSPCRGAPVAQRLSEEFLVNRVFDIIVTAR